MLLFQISCYEKPDVLLLGGDSNVLTCWRSQLEAVNTNKSSGDISLSLVMY